MKKINYPTSREAHRETNTPLYRRWQSMRSRTTCKSGNRHYYLEGNITVCEEWASFAAFKKWAILSGYQPNLQIDRINNTQGYSPDNCRWISHSENMANRRNTVFVVYEGEKIALTLLCDRLKIPQHFYQVVLARIKRGWGTKVAVETPLKHRNSK